jgi:hypothetical protein
MGGLVAGAGVEVGVGFGGDEVQPVSRIDGLGLNLLVALGYSYRSEHGRYLRFLLRQAGGVQAGVHLVPAAGCGSRNDDRDGLGRAQWRAPAAAGPHLRGLVARDGRVCLRHAPGGEVIGAPPGEDSRRRQDTDRVLAGLGDPTRAGTGNARGPQPTGTAQVDDQCRGTRQVATPGTGPLPADWIPQRQAHDAEARGGRCRLLCRSSRGCASDAGAAGRQRHQHGHRGERRREPS